MTTLREAAQQSLEALKMMRDEYEEYACPACDHADAAIYALRAALAAPVQEPVAWMTHGDDLLPLFHKTKAGALAWGAEPLPLYTAPPQRKPLTEEEIEQACAPPCATQECMPSQCPNCAIERAHGIGGQDES